MCRRLAIAVTAAALILVLTSNSQYDPINRTHCIVDELAAAGFFDPGPARAVRLGKGAVLHSSTRQQGVLRCITDSEGELSPMPPPMIGDPKHWRDRAARMQAMAVKMAGSLAAILMNDLAIHYDNLADQALKVRHREREIKGSKL